MGIDWRKPAVIDDALVVRTRPISAKGARMRLCQRLERNDGLIAEARVEVALIELSGKPAKLTPELAARLEPWLQSPAP
jgi:acyl-CoA thioester hydrolase